MDSEYLPVKKMKEVWGKYPHLIKNVNTTLRQKKLFCDKFPEEWPDHVFLPFRAWFEMSIIEHNIDKYIEHEDARIWLRAVQHVYALMTFGTWAFCKGVYSFDKDLEQEIVDTISGKSVPIDVLKNLPEFCCYVETARSAEHGFFVTTFFDIITKTNILYFIIVLNNGNLVNFHMLPLYRGSTVKESIARAGKTWADIGRQSTDKNSISSCSSDDAGRDMSEFFFSGVETLLPYVLYLCSEKPDIICPAQPGYLPRNPKPKKFHGAKKLLPAKNVHFFEVGSRIGAQLRQTRQAEAGFGTHASPRAHIRRAHWHGYWTGPRKGVQTFVLKWLHPMLINVSQEDQ